MHAARVGASGRTCDPTAVTSSRFGGVPGFSPRRTTPRTLLPSALHTTIVPPRDRHRSGRGPVVGRPLLRRWLPAGADEHDCGRRHRRRVGRRCRRPLSARRARLRPTIPSPAHVAPVASSVGVDRRWPDRRWAGSGGQLMTALAAASGENCPTRPGRHAVTKPVALCPPAVVRLVRALHPWPPTLSLRVMTFVDRKDVALEEDVALSELSEGHCRDARAQAPTVLSSG